jgi:hypothetical protein
LFNAALQVLRLLLVTVDVIVLQKKLFLLLLSQFWGAVATALEIPLLLPRLLNLPFAIHIRNTYFAKEKTIIRH